MDTNHADKDVSFVDAVDSSADDEAKMLRADLKRKTEELAATVVDKKHTERRLKLLERDEKRVAAEVKAVEDALLNHISRRKGGDPNSYQIFSIPLSRKKYINNGDTPRKLETMLKRCGAKVTYHWKIWNYGIGDPKIMIGLIINIGEISFACHRVCNGPGLNKSYLYAKRMDWPDSEVITVRHRHGLYDSDAKKLGIIGVVKTSSIDRMLHVLYDRFDPDRLTPENVADAMSSPLGYAVIRGKHWGWTYHISIGKH